MKNVCVFCAGNAGSQPAYLAAARKLGAAIAHAGLGLVYGGATVGLMGALADSALAAGGPVIGVIPSFMIGREIAHRGLTELVVVESMADRKNVMFDRSEAFVALPGGFGTLDELFEVLTLGQLARHTKPCVLLDVDGYYDHLTAFFRHAVDAGLLRAEHLAMLRVDADVDRVVASLVAS